eukprot:TRINITY_DN2831_c0_g1_i2.p1 TRINITY_DN2831_c0_g1~~TRINITY_DN2831_c0_g1_i2.p1  ORF type:complete len:76 (+),score=7.47 TRINITY_DN2831_c0_g1_i2:284-511(+)
MNSTDQNFSYSYQNIFTYVLVAGIVGVKKHNPNSEATLKVSRTTIPRLCTTKTTMYIHSDCQSIHNRAVILLTIR